MICPNCKSNVPDNKDLCQRCFTDLRPEKKRLGLQIQYPDDDFDTLLKRATGKLIPTPQTAPPPKREPPAPKAPNGAGTAASPSAGAPPARAPRQAERPREQRPPGSPEEIRAAMNEAWSELGSSGQAEIELGVEQFSRQLPLEEIELLFDIARDAVEDPEADRVLDFSAIKTAGTLHSERLEKLLGSVEKILDAPVLGLRGARAERLKANIRRLVTPELTGVIVMSSGRVRPAKLSSRLGAATIDFGICLGIGLAAALAYLALDPTAAGSILEPASLEPIDLVVPAGIAISASLLSLLIYPLIWNVLFDGTLGSKALRLQLSGEKGGKARFRNVFVRCASFPLSILCLGFVPALVGKRPLHDRIAKTILSRR